MAHAVQNDISTPKVSSPLRRKSVLPQKVLSAVLSENDDEAERSTLRNEMNAQLNTSDRRRSLGLNSIAQIPASQIKDRLLECIKLGTENKINPKNAFSLQMIDFMVHMVNKQDVYMSNLQVASTSLEVGTKIYGFRVDGVHMEILKLINGLDKNENANEPATANNSGETTSEQGNEKSAEKQAKKKKKKSAQSVLTNAAALKANVETEKVTPSVFGETDTQTTETLCQVMLPNHANSGFYLHQHIDVLVDTVDCVEATRADPGQYSDLSHYMPCTDDFSDFQICPTFYNFDFYNWNIDHEEAEAKEEQEKELEGLEAENNSNSFYFDINASIAEDNQPVFPGMNCFELEEENVEKCVQTKNDAEYLVDFQTVLSSVKPMKSLEYSFIQKSLNIHWAGPSHWRVNNLKKVSNHSKIVETCRQAPVKKRKEIDLNYDDVVLQAVTEKFKPSQAIKLQARTAKTEWNEEKLTLPLDEHYSIKQAVRLYLHPLIFCDNVGINVSDSDLPDDKNNYDYGDEVDLSGDFPECMIAEPDAERSNIENDVETQNVVSLATQRRYSGDNLVTVPKLANKVTIAYSVKAKKVDMRHLKKSIWKLLTSEDAENNNQPPIGQESDCIIGSKTFSDIYKKLPNLLTKSNAEALSFPISFVSLLHLANEKTLKVDTLSDLSDIIVKGSQSPE